MTLRQLKEVDVNEDEDEGKWDYVYCVETMAECDDYVHLVCLEDVWRKMQEAVGKKTKEREYAYLHYTHWTGGGEIYHIVTDWIAEMTVGLEWGIAAGEREECPA